MPLSPSANSARALRFVLELAAPGLQREDFHLEVDDHTLTISAEKENEQNEGENEMGFSRREYSYNSFSRSFVLPESVKEGSIEARYDNGVLFVTVPKLANEQPRPVKKITVS